MEFCKVGGGKIYAVELHVIWILIIIMAAVVVGMFLMQGR